MDLVTNRPIVLVEPGRRVFATLRTSGPYEIRRGSISGHGIEEQNRNVFSFLWLYPPLSHLSSRIPVPFMLL
jgi:hypothetical protein